MKHQQAILLSALLLSIGCTKKGDFSALALSSYLSPSLADADQSCPASSKAQTAAFNAPSSPFVTLGRKVQLPLSLGNADGPFTSFTAPNSRLPAGTALAVEVDVDCVEAERASGSEGLLTLGAGTEGRGIQVISRELTQDVSLLELEEMAENDVCVIGVDQLSFLHTSSLPNDPRLNEQRHHANIKADEGWDIFFQAQTGIKDDVVIAVIDSGVETTHPDLRAQLWVNSDETPGNGQDDDGNGYVDDVNGYNFVSRVGRPDPERWPGADAGGEAHGTHVAGLSAAASDNSTGGAGVNGLKSKIMGLNVFGPQAGAGNDSIANAIRYAANNGANIINMSLGGPGTSSVIESAITYAIGRGVFVVVAAGNDSRDINTNIYSPASYGSRYQGMVTVGAMNGSNNAICSFSNFSAVRVELAAPGCEEANGRTGLLSTITGGAYGRMAGTSMASPVAAGAASLAFGLIKNRTGNAPSPALLEEVLLAGSRVEAGLGGQIKGGKTVDLKVLGEEINQRFPASSSTPPPKVECP